MAKLDNEALAQVYRQVAEIREEAYRNGVALSDALRTEAQRIFPPPKPEPVFPTDWNCVIERATGNIHYNDAVDYLSHNPGRSRRAKRTVAPDGTITIKPIEE
jgi:hypothetical protein